MKYFLEIDETTPALEQSFKAAIKLKHELPTDRDENCTTFETFIFS